MQAAPTARISYGSWRSVRSPRSASSERSGLVYRLHILRTMKMAKVEITVNGAKQTREVEDRRLLADFLRDELGLTGTHIGCDTTQCGCCTVHVNGRAVKSCTMLAVQANGTDVLTIEGLAKDGKLHP